MKGDSQSETENKAGNTQEPEESTSPLEGTNLALERRLMKRQAAASKEATMDGHLKETTHERVSEEAARATSVETDVA